MQRLILAALGLFLAAEPVLARDLLVTIARPQNLYVFDAEKRELVSDCDLGVFPSPGVIAISPDGRSAYALVNRWQDVIGIDILSCERVFYAAQSEPPVSRRSIASLAVSKDGQEIYTVRNPVMHHIDRHEVLDPEFAVFKTADGVGAEPVRVFPAPRRSTIMQTDALGNAYIAGHDIYRIDPQTGALETAIPLRHWDRPLMSGPDVLAFWPLGAQNNEFLLMYSALTFATEAHEEITGGKWGFSTVDLETGETHRQDLADLEFIIFSAVRNPQNPNELFGVFNTLSKYNVETGELLGNVPLPQTYYVVNIATDGSEVYLAGTNDTIRVYDTEALEPIGEMRIPSGGDMSTATLQVVSLPAE